MDVIVAGGSRYQPVLPDDLVLLDRLHEEFRFTRLISGMANGADALGVLWARENQIPIAPFEPAWNSFLAGRAGMRRNQLMADAATLPALLVAFPGGNGTRDMTERALKRGLAIYANRGLGWNWLTEKPEIGGAYA